MQGYLTALDMGELVSAGMVSINVLFSSDVQVCTIHHVLQAADIMWLRCRAIITVPGSSFLGFAPRCSCCALLVTAALGLRGRSIFVQVTNLTFLPALEATTGIPTGLSTDFTKPFISQLKINGEPYGHAAHLKHMDLQSSIRAALHGG